MTSREKTALLTLDDAGPARPLSEKLFTVAWGAIQWPWLARAQPLDRLDDAPQEPGVGLPTAEVR